jgi:ABC-type nitrate/sulfonate/bicarbonate transport system permease component
MFAVILLVSVISLLLMGLVRVLQRRCMPWAYLNEEINK